MNDRELLELAATAVGYDISHSMNTERLMLTPSVDALLVRKDGKIVTTGWNPLIDDGDALRLAVELKINLTYLAKENEFNHAVAANDVKEWAGNGGRVAVGPGYAVATRRAIVRAAAEIGKAKSKPLTPGDAK